jgi:hypothetical protein
MSAELAAAMVRMGGDDLQKAMIKAAQLSLPRAPSLPKPPSLGDSKSTTPRLPSHTTAMPQTDQTQPGAIAPQKNIAPPAI